MRQYFVERERRRKKKKNQKIENPEYRKIFIIIFSLKETEDLEGWWWWLWLGTWFGSCTFCTLSTLWTPWCPLIRQTRVHLSCTHSANIYKGSAVSRDSWQVLCLEKWQRLGLWPRSSGIGEVKVKIFKLIRIHWVVCLTQMQMVVCLFLCVTVFTYSCFLKCKGKTPTFLLYRNVFFSWTTFFLWISKPLITDFCNFLIITTSFAEDATFLFLYLTSIVYPHQCKCCLTCTCLLPG